MFGCSRRPAATASFLKRAIDCSTRSGSTKSLRTVLIATTRSMPGSNALYTTPIAPLPRTLWTSYFPILTGSAMKFSLALQHLDRLDHARFHAVQSFGEHADFIAAARAEVTRLEIA